MSIDKKLEALKKIRPVEAPPFLFTRIEAQINAAGNAVSPRWRWSAIAGFGVLVLINIYVVSQSLRPKQPGIESVVNTMALSTSNNLYDE